MKMTTANDSGSGSDTDDTHSVIKLCVHIITRTSWMLVAADDIGTSACGPPAMTDRTMMVAPESDDIGPRCDVAAVVVHVGNDTFIPPAMAPFYISSDCRQTPIMYHDGNLLCACDSTASDAIYAGVVSTAQPRQHLAPESMLIAAVVVGGSVAVVVDGCGGSAPMPGTAFAEPRGGNVAGTIVAASRMITPDRWVCLGWLAPPLRAQQPRRLAAPDGDAAAGIFFLLQPGETAPPE